MNARLGWWHCLAHISKRVVLGCVGDCVNILISPTVFSNLGARAALQEASCALKKQNRDTAIFFFHFFFSCQASAPCPYLLVGWLLRTHGARGVLVTDLRDAKPVSLFMHTMKGSVSFSFFLFSFYRDPDFVLFRDPRRPSAFFFASSGRFLHLRFKKESLEKESCRLCRCFD